MSYDSTGEKIKLRYETLLVEREEILDKLEAIEERLRKVDMERHLHFFENSVTSDGCWAMSNS